MSRLGKIPINIPKGVKVTVGNSQVVIEGPRGKLVQPLPLGVSIENKEERVFVKREIDSKQHRANQGTIRALVSNMITGVTEGHKESLEIQGVGFRAQIQGQKLTLNLGFSHPVEYNIPEGVKVKTAKPTEIEIEGIDKALVGETAANIRHIKPPEPYKGKGVRYVGEFVRRKQGKQVTK